MSPPRDILLLMVLLLFDRLDEDGQGLYIEVQDIYSVYIVVCANRKVILRIVVYDSTAPGQNWRERN
jgi:hypothetical protein